MIKFGLGLAIDCDPNSDVSLPDMALFRKAGKVDVLNEYIHG